MQDNQESNDGPGNIEESIHNKEYLAPHLSRPITAESLMADWSRERISLNGEWNYFIDQYDTCLRAGWYKFSNNKSILENFQDQMERFGIPKAAMKIAGVVDLVSLARRLTPMDFDFDQWDTMDIPASWNTVSEKFFYYEGPVTFTRKFDYDLRSLKKDGDRVFLRIGGANYRTVVILNGQPMGCHLGGGTDFFVELTDNLQKRNNRLIIVVDSTRRADQIPAENFDWFNYGGIHRDIELIQTPQIFIQNFSLSLMPDGQYSNIECAVKLSDPVDASVTLLIPELFVEDKIDISQGEGKVTLSVEDLQLWSPENPKLYDITLSLGQTGKPDTLKDHVGFRQIQAVGTEIHLNGKPLFLKGVSCHEESVDHGRSLSLEEIKENIRLTKEMGCNYLRLAHYPHNRMTARLADEAGLMLWEEIPVYWAIEFNSDKTFTDACNQLTELILRDHNRASVIIWSVGNENADTDERLQFMSGLVQTCRKLDPTRLVSAACLTNWREETIEDRLSDVLDVIGINEYFGWYEPNVKKLKRFFSKSKIDKPVVISEFGAGMKFGHHGSSKSFFTHEKHEVVYKEQVRVIKNIPEICGTSPWILYDFRCPRRNNLYQNQYNLKGLLTADKRSIKPGYQIMKDFYDSIDF